MDHSQAFLRVHQTRASSLEATARNRSFFANEFPYARPIFEEILRDLASIVEGLKLPNGKGYNHSGLIPLHLHAARQFETAFYILESCQCGQAWLLLRPGIESVLFSGRFIQNPPLAQKWLNQKADRKSYARAFFGRRLASGALRRQSELREVHRRINDTYVHPNPVYVTKNAGREDLGGGSFLFHVFSVEDESVVIASTAAFLHLCAVITTDLSGALAERVPGFPEIEVTDREFRKRHLHLIDRGRSTSSGSEILENLGLVPLVVEP